ncbi:Asp-tRNA(Asn)/Glu-tRNA(Gln) amidotransferase subunit GatC [Candidatus Woesearchaeota archaeon]|nr:Asp-tRNA(Asn)/Glu-tRNA(Gln) amidotransferase subunit GatC [Candidatus Woesearchaeota archaeon]
MEVSKEFIKKVVANARLKLTDEEISNFIPELKEILEHFSKLNKLKTDNVKPSFHPIELKNVMREDVAKRSLSQEEALSNTRHKKDNYFKGPRAI